MSQGDISEKELLKNLPYLLQFLSSHSSSNNTNNLPENSNNGNSLGKTEKSFISSILKEKYNSLSQLLANALEQIEQTKSLEKTLLSYLDYSITKVENHLIQIDFWQNHNLHKDIMTLRAQMQQQLFQLEQEKVRTQTQINSQQIQLSREARSLIKELNEIKIQLNIFSKQNGRPL